MNSLPLLPTISTTFIVLSAITVAIGWVQIKQRKIETHRKTMTIAAVFALIFFIIYASRTIFIGNTAFGGPDDIKIYYTVFLIFHITLSTTGAVFGIISLTSGYKNNLKTTSKTRTNHKHYLVFYRNYRSRRLPFAICFLSRW